MAECYDKRIRDRERNWAGQCSAWKGLASSSVDRVISLDTRSDSNMGTTGQTRWDASLKGLGYQVELQARIHFLVLECGTWGWPNK